MRAHARQAGESIDEWLQSADRRRRCKYGLAGLEVDLGGAPSCIASVAPFSVDRPPQLQSWPVRLAPEVVVRPASTVISAPRTLVWAVMTDFGAFSEWNPLHRSVRVLSQDPGRVFLDLRVALLSETRLTRSLEEVFYCDSARFIIIYGLPAGPVNSLRAQWLTEDERGGTIYHSYDVLGGNLSWLLRGFMERQVLEGFNRQHEALKRRCEALALAPRSHL
jgi:hypothetical protein